MKKTFEYSVTAPIIHTEKGSVRGFIKNGILTFKGIPYGKACRFHECEEVSPWKDVRDCTNYGYVCPLMNMNKATGEIKVPHRYWAMDEDCLNLNIWTPLKNIGKKKPVLVWLHGGGFEEGSSIEQLAYDGTEISSFGDVVFVSINHRLNILGYFDLSDFGKEYEKSGNLGTLDIVAALKWIQKNIEAFGGDAQNVTLIGQSGGGAKITALLQTPLADGLYHKCVNMSGVLSGLVKDARGSGKELCTRLLQELNIQTIGELEKIDYRLLFSSYQKLRKEFEAAGKYAGCAPHPDKFYYGDPLYNGFRKESSSIPLIVGSVYGEFSSFDSFPFNPQSLTEKQQKEYVCSIAGKDAFEKVFPIYKKAYPKNRIIDFLRLDLIFRQPMLEFIRKRVEQGGLVYNYLFDYTQPIDNGTKPWHCADIPYILHNINL